MITVDVFKEKPMTRKRRKLRRDKNIEVRREFIELAETIVHHPEYSKMKHISHHSASVYAHSVNVAYFSYRIANRLGLDKTSTARGGLLHDFYLYKFDEQRSSKYILIDALKHTIQHPREALRNAEKHFKLNRTERNIIRSHMFPVGLPKSPEAMVVTMVDKGLAIYEYALNFSQEWEARYEGRFIFVETQSA